MHARALLDLSSFSCMAATLYRLAIIPSHPLSRTLPTTIHCREAIEVISLPRWPPFIITTTHPPKQLPHCLISHATWLSQDACSLSSHYEPVYTTSWSQAKLAGGLTMSLIRWVWAPEVPPEPLADGWDMVRQIGPPANPRYPSQLGGLVWGWC